MAANEPNGSTGATPAAGASPESGRALSLGDALGYLDAVKKEFETRPDVYNKFLDIMKDFKSTAYVSPSRSIRQAASRVFAFAFSRNVALFDFVSDFHLCLFAGSTRLA